MPAWIQHADWPSEYQKAMSKAHSAGNKSTASPTDVQPTTDTTSRTSIADIVTDDFRLTEWDVFRTVAECSEDTIHGIRP